MHNEKLMLLSRRTVIKTCAALTLPALLAPQCFADEKDGAAFKIGTCDWSIKMQLSGDAFQFARRNGLRGIQYSFDAAGNGLDLRLRGNRDTIRNTVAETGVGISSLGIGLLNRVPFALTEEGEKLVVECLETMATLKEEAAELKDRDLAAKVSPKIVLLAFFGKADINGKPDLIENVIEKLKRVAPLAEKHGFILGLETLLSEEDHRHIIESVGSPAVKVYYDTGNSARMGYDIYREIESLGTEKICEIHIKENGALLGKGDIDFEKVKSLLKTINYKGWLIIEGSTPKGMSREEGCEKNAAYALNHFNS